ncbi:SIMPL domain-containing protein [Veillonella sp. VA139]|uniref:SIMPL domain-containing protein n=1 Tax=Veillonella sp. VA139 TaxID=741830 RepID=UPI000F8F0EA6|nr:SIMPL domain-containing protein [Veillonella sp. VA139]
MKHSFLLKAFTIGALMTSVAVGAMAADIPPGEISVTGQAIRQVAPSYALLNLGVSNENTSVQAAKAQNDAVMSKLISSLQHLGISKNNIQTSNITINPNYNYIDGNSKLNGYHVTNTVVVKVYDTSSIGKAIDAAIASGASDINSLTFQTDVSQEMEDQLSTSAISDARHQAEVIARALGHTVGPVKSINLGTTRTHTMEVNPRYAMLSLKSVEMSTSTPVENGDMSANKTANVVFYLQ